MNLGEHLFGHVTSVTTGVDLKGKSYFGGMYSFILEQELALRTPQHMPKLEMHLYVSESVFRVVYMKGDDILAVIEHKLASSKLKRIKALNKHFRKD